ncbi:MAG: PAS domain-containing protein [Nitrospinae bacterium]|nr:PAS domain-containing protein [Nitrospinota bacterium]
MAETPSAEDERKKEIEILGRAFASFTEATQQLQNSYDILQARVQALDLELAEKNAELEKNLKEKEDVKNYLNNILESLTTGVMVVDRQDRITTCNKAFGSITGHSPGQCRGKNVREAFSPDFFEIVSARLARPSADPSDMDREFVAPDRRKIDIRVAASPALDADGNPIGAVVLVQDVTQLKRLEEEAQRNQRLRAMGEMAAGIAHEIRNPLGSIELFASLLKEDLKGDDEKRQLAERICSGVHNMDRIISNALLFASSPQPSRQKCDINRLLTEILEFWSDVVLPDSIRIVRQFDAEALAKADSELLKQVFLNLIRNAVQAMPDGGELRLTTRKTADAALPPGASPAPRQFITIAVSDTGVGIPPDCLPKIFNPFFTTKDKGTGLGLAIAHNIVKAHQGALDVDSAEGRGTTFTVKIPCWDEER